MRALVAVRSVPVGASTWTVSRLNPADRRADAGMTTAEYAVGTVDA
jgi:hypothetical protein